MTTSNQEENKQAARKQPQINWTSLKIVENPQNTKTQCPHARLVCMCVRLARTKRCSCVRQARTRMCQAGARARQYCDQCWSILINTWLIRSIRLILINSDQILIQSTQILTIYIKIHQTYVKTNQECHFPKQRRIINVILNVVLLRGMFHICSQRKHTCTHRYGCVSTHEHVLLVGIAPKIKWHHVDVYLCQMLYQSWIIRGSMLHVHISTSAHIVLWIVVVLWLIVALP